jgi:hypothetical protein
MEERWENIEPLVEVASKFASLRSSLHLDQRPRIAEQHFSRGLDHSGLPRSSRPKEQQVPYRQPRRIQPSTKDLVQIDDGLHRFILPHDPLPQPCFEIS